MGIIKGIVISVLAALASVLALLVGTVVWLLSLIWPLILIGFLTVGALLTVLFPQHK